MKNPLLDKEFIELLEKTNSREIYAKIINLTLDEYPIEEIQGKVSQGNLNIDGSSAVRRTCSLTMIADRVNINEYYWSFATKFKLYIGLKVPDIIKNMTIDDNNSIAEFNENSRTLVLLKDKRYLYKDYPDIIWFPQGIFLITDFKLTLNTNGTDNIYITGKDKMCKLNGELGGNFPHATDVGTIEQYEYDENNNLIDIKKPPLTIKNIIREMVHKYANEPFHNIIINDLDKNATQLLNYKGNNDIYLLRNVETGLFENVLFNGQVERYDKNGNARILAELTENELDNLNTDYLSVKAVQLKNTNSITDTTYYTVVKSTYGAFIGRRTTDWTFPSGSGNAKGELIANARETITSVLDKICETFDNNFEYFYDIQGRFVFQQKINYVNTSWNNLVDTWELNEKEELQKTAYAESSKLMSQVQYSFVGKTLFTVLNNNPNINNIKNDYVIWGRKKSDSDSQDNSIHLRCAIDEKPEKYVAWDGTVYTSDKWDWRELIYRMAVDHYAHNHDDDYEIVLQKNNPEYHFGYTGYEPYYVDMQKFWRELYNPESDDNITYRIQEEDNKYWNRNVSTNPAALHFWFDFLDGKTTNLGKYSVKAIGDRPKVINNDKIKAIYYGEIPNIIYITQEEYTELKTANLVDDGYTYIILPEQMDKYFEEVDKDKSAQDELDQLIYQYAYCNESISITSIPIYHLEPNVRISVYDDKTKINGEYIVDKINIALGYNGTMTISATKAPARLF